MGAVSYIGDGLRNLVANLGTSRDKVSANEYTIQELSFDQLESMYRSAWLPRKIVDIPAFDTARSWRSWQAEADQITALEAEEKRLGLVRKAKEALVTARLLGGSALLIGTGEEDLSLPLNVEQIQKGGLKYVTHLDRRDLVAGQIDYAPASENFGKPMWYELASAYSGALRVHPSRLCIFHGMPPVGSGASRINPWGDPVLQSVYDAVSHSDSTSANIASLVFEAKVDTIGIPNLTQRLQDRRTEQMIQERLQLAQRAKGINGALIHDSEEEIGQKTASFSNLDKVLLLFFQQVSGAADIPMTRLFGMSPGGLNSTGEGDLQNYYDRIQAMQSLEVEPAMALLDECLIRSALGERPDEVHFNWRSLWSPSQKETTEIGKLIAETGSSLAASKIMPRETIGRAIANSLIESGSMPGLEAAIEEFGLELEDPFGMTELDPNEPDPNTPDPQQPGERDPDEIEAGEEEE